MSRLVATIATARQLGVHVKQAKWLNVTAQLPSCG